MTYIQYIQQSWREKKEKNKKNCFSTIQQPVLMTETSALCCSKEVLSMLSVWGKGDISKGSRECFTAITFESF